MLAVLLSAYLQQQYGTVIDNFTANRNVHYVAVTFRSGGDIAGTGALRFSDIDAVAQVAAGAAKGGTQAIGQFRIPFGLTASDGQTSFVFGLSDGGAGLLGRATLPDGIAVGGTSARPGTVLDVPVVEREVDGGMSSDRLEQVRLDIEPMVVDPPVGVFQTVDLAALYVNEATFARLIGIVAGGVDWQTFRTAHDGTANPYGFEAASAVYVHVDDLRDVDLVGRALERSGYSTAYTLRAFDDLAGTLAVSVTTGAGLMAAVLVLCLVLTFTNLQSYLNLAHRDMGILQHIGYSQERVRRIYRHRLLTTVAGAAVPATVLALAAGASELGSRRWFAALDLMVLAVLAAALFAVMAGVQLPRHVGRPVLALLKLDRQFE